MNEQTANAGNYRRSADSFRRAGGCDLFLRCMERLRQAGVGAVCIRPSLPRMAENDTVGVALMLIAEITNQEALEWLQSNQKKLEKTVTSAIPAAVQLARRYAPVKTGLLRKGIIAMPGLENTRFQGKAVGEVVLDRGMNNVFQKPSRKGHHYYYPASQEYGFKHRIRGGGTKRVEGKHYMHVASRVYEGPFAEKVINMVEDLFAELD